MTEREKVIKGLEICTTRPCYCTDCPYKANCCLDSQEVMEDALALLKEQNEPMKPTLNENHRYVSDAFKCGKCGHTIRFHAKYCEECGQAVQWEVEKQEKE